MGFIYRSNHTLLLLQDTYSAPCISSLALETMALPGETVSWEPAPADSKALSNWQVWNSSAYVSSLWKHLSVKMEFFSPVLRCPKMRYIAHVNRLVPFCNQRTEIFIFFTDPTQKHPEGCVYVCELTQVSPGHLPYPHQDVNLMQVTVRVETETASSKSYQGMNKNTQKCQCCRFQTPSYTRMDNGKKILQLKRIVLWQNFKVQTGVVNNELIPNSVLIHRKLLQSWLWSWYKSVCPFLSGTAFLWQMNTLLFDGTLLLLKWQLKKTAVTQY